MNLEDKVNRDYKKMHYTDSRATKKNLRAYYRAKENGYTKQFNDYCYEHNLGDGRKMRNGKSPDENHWTSHILPVLFFAFIVWCALYYYGSTALFIPVCIVSLIIRKVLGTRRTVGLLFVIFIVYCIISYR